MRLLSLDTSFSFFNFSIVEDGKVVLLHYLDTPTKTLKNLPAVFKRLNINLEDFDAFAVSVGIGYLTSLRIGTTFIKTCAYLLGKPIVSYENLSLLANFTPIKGIKVPFLKVSSNLFYRVCENGNISDVRIYKGEKLRGTGISLKVFADASPLDDNFFHPLFPFSAYGGIYAYEFLKENPSGEEPFRIEPIYMKPPA